MHILFLGFSSILRRRILPALPFTPYNRVSIAKSFDRKWRQCEFNCERFDSYELAFQKCKPDLVYISTINSTHAALIRRALDQGWHVVVEKPATTDPNVTLELLSLARSRKLLLSEAVSYLFHPQMELLKETLQQRGLYPNHLTVHFSFPPMNPDNFRYRRELGGGALLDTGPYVCSIGRYLFDSLPEAVTMFHQYNEGEIDISYVTLARYSGGRSLMALCGFNTQYINRLTILGEDFSLQLDRAFTIPDALKNSLILNIGSRIESIASNSGSQFARYLSSVADALKSGVYENFYNSMEMDARALLMLIQSKGI
jgi:NDP-hexose-3-ketoreductase